jgi:hypothetical protein
MKTVSDVMGINITALWHNVLKLGFRQKVSHPTHAKGDLIAQELMLFLSSKDNIVLFCLAIQPTLGHCWALRGLKKTVKVKLG